MIRASFEGIISSKLKKKGDLYILSVRTGRDVIKCLTSIDVSDDLEKGSKVFVDGHYSITNALFPISKIYKIVGNKKILLNPISDNIIEETQRMSPMTKKQKAKDGTFPAPASLKTREKESEIDFGFKIPEVQPSDFITSTKPVSKELKMEMEKSSLKKEEKKVVKAPIVNDDTHVENNSISSVETNTENTEEPTDEPVEVNDFMINIPIINTDTDDSNSTETAQNVSKETIPAENHPKQNIEEHKSDDLETDTDLGLPLPSNNVITAPKTEEPINEVQPEPEKKPVLIDDDFDLPLPNFGKSISSAPTVKVNTEPKKPAVVQNIEKPKNETKKVVPTASYPQKENHTEEKVVKTPTTSNSKFPVRFSNDDLL